MSLSDTIADMLTRIRNAARNSAPQVDCRNSKICTGIARVLKEEGYINDYNVVDDGRQGILRIDLESRQRSSGSRRIEWSGRLPTSRRSCAG